MKSTDAPRFLRELPTFGNETFELDHVIIADSLAPEEQDFKIIILTHRLLRASTFFSNIMQAQRDLQAQLAQGYPVLIVGTMDCIETFTSSQ